MSAPRARMIAGWVALATILLFCTPGFAATCSGMQVSFSDGKLAIHSSGCSLQQVLEAVQLKTGIVLDMPAAAANTPVTADLPLGDPAAVLTAILQPTPFNFAFAGGNGRPLTAVILSVRSAAPEPPVMAKAATPLPTAAKPQGTLTAKNGAKSTAAKDKKKAKEKKADDDVVAEDEDTGPKKRAEVDPDTLKKLPQLPPGVPADMWSLYPDLVANGGKPVQGPPQLPPGATPEQIAAVQSGQPIPNFYYQDPSLGPKGVVGQPTLPPGIDPNMGKLYPWNLMQLVNQPVTAPNLQLPPMVGPIGVPQTGAGWH